MQSTTINPKIQNLWQRDSIQVFTKASNQPHRLLVATYKTTTKRTWLDLIALPDELKQITPGLIDSLKKVIFLEQSRETKIHVPVMLHGFEVSGYEHGRGLLCLTLEINDADTSKLF